MSGSTRWCDAFPEYPQHCCISCHEDNNEYGFDLLVDWEETYEVCCGVYNKFIEPREAADE